MEAVSPLTPTVRVCTLETIDCDVNDPIAEDAILRTLDGMAASKLNLFHWHITDSHSFPLVSTRRPKLTTFGAYSDQHVYTSEQIKKIVQYARDRSILVSFHYG